MAKQQNKAKKPTAKPATRPAAAAPAAPRQNRLNTSTVVCGRKGCGKSTLLRGMANEYVTANARAYLGQGKRVLICDTNGAPAYKDLPLLSSAQLAAWKPNGNLKIARYCDPDKKKMVNDVATHFKQGLVIFEDALGYINPAAIPQNVRAFLVDHRMADLDLIFTFHAVMTIPPFFWLFQTYLILLKTNENREKIARTTKIADTENLLKEFDRIAASQNPYISTVIETGL